MNLCSLEDMMANTVLVNAKNDMSSRKKWINKVRFPGERIYCNFNYCFTLP